MCMFILEDDEYLIFDFNFEITSINTHLGDIKLLHDLKNKDIQYYYIDNNHYLFNNKLYICSNGNINDLSKKNLITLKSSISDKQESISKDILISRCELFKGIFELYDEKDSNNELINEKFEDIDIYYDYITNGKIKDMLKLFDICLYFGDIDIEYIINYIIKYINYKNIHFILNKLNDFPKYKNILLNKYFKHITKEEYINFISKCDYDLLKHITIYNMNKILTN